VGGGSQRGFESRAQFIECQLASREVLAQGRGSRVPVGIANAHARGWCLTMLSGHLGQVPQHGSMAIQHVPARLDIERYALTQSMSSHLD
jgi:hypothetical protein